MEDTKEADIRKKYPSLPPNYVSLAQLQERWIQQKEKELEQKEQIVPENHQEAKEENGFNGSSKKNGVGRIKSQGSHVRRNEELRVDDDRFYVPRRQWNGNHGQIREAKSKWKSKKLEFQASGDAAGSGIGNAKYKKYNKNEGLNGEAILQTLSGNGGASGILIGKNSGEGGCLDYEDKKVEESVSVYMVELAPEIKEEENPVGFSRKPYGKHLVDNQFSNGTDNCRDEAKPLGKQVLNDQFSNSTNNWRFDAKSRGKQVADDKFSYGIDSWRVEGKSCGEQMVADRFLNTSGSWKFDGKSRGKQVVGARNSNSSDNWRVEAKSCEKQLVNDQCLHTTDSRTVEATSLEKEDITGEFLGNKGVRRSPNEYMEEVLPENGTNDDVSVGLSRKNGKKKYSTKYVKYKRSGNDKGLPKEGNVCVQGLLQDNEAEEERRKTGRERSGSRYQGNEGNSRMNRNSKEIQLKPGQQLVEEGVFLGGKERTGPEARTSEGARAHGNKDRVYHWIGRDFGDLSLSYRRKGNSSRGHRQSYGNYGISSHRKGRQVDRGLVWVKKEEISDTMQKFHPSGHFDAAAR